MFFRIFLTFGHPRPTRPDEDADLPGRFFPFGPENLGVPGFRELYLRAQEELGVVLGLYPCVRKQYFPFAPLRATRNRVRHL